MGHLVGDDRGKHGATEDADADADLRRTGSTTAAPLTAQMRFFGLFGFGSIHDHFRVFRG